MSPGLHLGLALFKDSLERVYRLLIKEERGEESAPNSESTQREDTRKSATAGSLTFVTDEAQKL
jgi:hypothetical protein